MKDINITGTIIWYYYICKREVWLMSRNLTPDQDDVNIELGRFFHNESYNRDKKEISLGNIVIDVVKKDNGQLVVGEVKKTSKYQKSARMQLLFYLKQLKEVGIMASGYLFFPKEKKKVEVELKKDDEKELEKVINDIFKIIYLDKPPKVEKNNYCRNCGYKDICYS